MECVGTGFYTSPLKISFSQVEQAFLVSNVSLLCILLGQVAVGFGVGGKFNVCTWKVYRVNFVECVWWGG